MSKRFDKWLQSMEDRKGSRQRVDFWLDWNNPDDVELIKIIAFLKDEQSFSKVIRLALSIIPALMYEANLEPLFAAFPWIRAEFMEYMREIHEATSEAAPSTTTKIETDESLHASNSDEATQQLVADQAWLKAEQERFEAEWAWHEKQLEAAKQALEQERRQLQAERSESQQAIQKQLARLEELLLNQGYQPITTAASRTNGGLKPIAGALKPLIPPAQYDDDDDMLLEVKPATKPAGGKSAAQNFVAAMFALADQKPDSTANRGNRRMKGLST